MIEKAYPGEPIRDPRWLTVEGAHESARRVIGQVQVALKSAEAFYAYIMPGWGFYPLSPAEDATRDGMQRFGAFEQFPEKV